MIAPLMTCSARLPVYALLIGAFIPQRSLGPFNLQGLVLFALYGAGVLSALLVALVLKRTVMRGELRPLMLELPEYRLPNLRNLALGLWERARIFLGRVGTIILTLMVVLWFLASFPGAARRARPGPRFSTASPACWGARWQSFSRRSDSTGRSPSRWCPGWRRAKWRSARLAPCTRCPASGDAGQRFVSGDRQHAGASRPACRCWPGTCSRRNACRRSPSCERETNSWRYPLIMAGYLFAMAYVGRVRDLPRRRCAWRRLSMAALQSIIVALLVIGAPSTAPGD